MLFNPDDSQKITSLCVRLCEGVRADIYMYITCARKQKHMCAEASGQHLVSPLPPTSAWFHV